MIKSKKFYFITKIVFQKMIANEMKFQDQDQDQDQAQDQDQDQLKAKVKL